MAAAVDALLADDGQREALGARAREKLFADFTVDAGAPRLLATCRRVAGKAPRVSSSSELQTMRAIFLSGSPDIFNRPIETSR
jgi:hypothetical protein